MRVDIYNLSFETPQVSFHLWSPWRAAALEHKLFETVQGLPHVRKETGPDERRVLITDAKTCKAALQAIARVLKGWQEDAEPGGERRSWRWLIEGDSDAYGYDHTGEVSSLWCLVRVSLDRGAVGEGEKGEDIDLEGFSLRIWPTGGNKG